MHSTSSDIDFEIGRDGEGSVSTCISLTGFEVGKDQLRLQPPQEIDWDAGGITCLPGRFAIKRKVQEKTESGLYLPPSGSLDTDCGEVFEVGEGVDVAVGDWVACVPNHGCWIQNPEVGVEIRFYGVGNNWESSLVARWCKVKKDWVPARGYRRGTLEREYVGMLELPDSARRPKTMRIRESECKVYVIRAGDAFGYCLYGSDGYVYFPVELIEGIEETC
jgi:hypothetical protein